jgi:hypothetical protein
MVKAREAVRQGLVLRSPKEFVSRIGRHVMAFHIWVVMAMILPNGSWAVNDVPRTPAWARFAGYGSAGKDARAMQEDAGLQDAGYIVNHYFDSASGDAFGYARVAVTETGARLIEPNHLVLGILRSDPAAIRGFLRPDWTLERLNAAVFLRDPTATPIPEHVGVPTSPAAIRAIVRAKAIADASGCSHVGSLHLLAALLEDESISVVQTLKNAGLHRQSILESLRRQ